MKFWITNVAPGTSDEEIKDLVKKYAPALECTHLERFEGTGSRPSAMLELTGGPEALENLARRLNGMYWKERTLFCSTLGT